MKLQYTRNLNLSPEENEQLRLAFKSQDYFDVVTTVPTTSTLKKGQIQFYSDGTDLWIYTSDGTAVKSQKFGTNEGLVGDYTVDDTGVSDGMVLYYDSATDTIKFKTLTFTDTNNSNVLFVWNGNTTGHLYNAATNLADFHVNVLGSSYSGVLLGKIKKIAGISTVTILASIKTNDDSGSSTAFCKVDIGGCNNEVTSDSESYGYVTAADIDISSLTNGTVYNLEISLKNENETGTSYLNQITLIGS